MTNYEMAISFIRVTESLSIYLTDYEKARLMGRIMESPSFSKIITIALDEGLYPETVAQIVKDGSLTTNQIVSNLRNVLDAVISGDTTITPNNTKKQAI